MDKKASAGRRERQAPPGVLGVLADLPEGGEVALQVHASVKAGNRLP